MAIFFYILSVVGILDILFCNRMSQLTVALGRLIDVSSDPSKQKRLLNFFLESGLGVKIFSIKAHQWPSFFFGSIEIHTIFYFYFAFDIKKNRILKV